MASISSIKVGLEIAEKKFGPDSQFGGAQHDVVYLFPPGIELTPEERQSLEEAGWRLSATEGWYHFV